jgi:hypothetical protein
LTRLLVTIPAVESMLDDEFSRLGVDRRNMMLGSRRSARDPERAEAIIAADGSLLLAHP